MPLPTGGSTDRTSAQLDVSPTSPLAAALVHSNLATLLAVNDTRAGLIVAYPSEPIVARAALHVLHSDTVDILRFVRQSLLQGLISTTAGAAGELVGRLLLLLHRPVDNLLSDAFGEFELPAFFSRLIGTVLFHASAPRCL